MCVFLLKKRKKEIMWNVKNTVDVFLIINFVFFSYLKKSLHRTGINMYNFSNYTKVITAFKLLKLKCIQVFIFETFCYGCSIDNKIDFRI